MMRKIRSLISLNALPIAVAVTVLIGCGGGSGVGTGSSRERSEPGTTTVATKSGGEGMVDQGSSSTASSTSSATSAQASSQVLIITGTAATGTPASGTVVATCVSGTGASTVTADGSYRLELINGTGPCLLELTSTNSLSMYSFTTGTELQAAANITPLTTLFVDYLRALPGGTTGSSPPLVWFQNASVRSLLTNPASVRARAENGFLPLMRQMSGLSVAHLPDNLDFLTKAFVADPTVSTHDATLEKLSGTRPGATSPLFFANGAAKATTVTLAAQVAATKEPIPTPIEALQSTDPTLSVQGFKPARLVAFGDEASAFTPGGDKYTVNDDANGCQALPIWVQVVANGYGFGFAQCPVGAGPQKAVSRAAPGATVSSLIVQIATQVDLGSTDLVTVLVGTNDLKDLYTESTTVGSRPRAALLTDARGRGVELGQQINALTERGARVLVSTVPDLGLSPFGTSRGAAEAALLSDLSRSLNDGLRIALTNDGRKIGLVLADELVQSASANPGSLGLVNVTGETCAAPLPGCTLKTMVAGAEAGTWLWADDFWFAHGGHQQLGLMALTRARGNPF